MSSLPPTPFRQNKEPASPEKSDFGDSDSVNKESDLTNHDESNGGAVDGRMVVRLRFRIKKPDESKSDDDPCSQLVTKKVEMGASESKLGASKLVLCRFCENEIYPGEKVSCSIHGCQVSYHLTCAKDHVRLFRSSKEFKCPQHACFLCKKKSHLWRCSRCDLATHDKCAAYPEEVLHSNEGPGKIICWRHSTEWPRSKDIFSRLPLPYVEEEFKIDEILKEKMADDLEPPSCVNIKDVFSRLPLPFVEEEFKIDDILKEHMVDDSEPRSYVNIRRNIYLIKKKPHDEDDIIGCTNCGSEICYEDCMCRLQCISCSNACGCSEVCTNRPFQNEKKVKVFKTTRCGWGVEASEFIRKGDFIIEYVGEVINDALCETRFWDLSNLGVKNFYICQVRKDFNIDATFKGNKARFLNHSCAPNCNLEKWEVDGETRLGVFAARSIKRGEPLTYHYRFVQFGPEVECYCGASICQGYLGAKKKVPKWEWVDWGAKGRRSF